MNSAEAPATVRSQTVVPRSSRSAPWRRALNIALLYAVLATAWIYFSDRALLALAPDATTYGRWSVVKGWGFVLVTTLVLFWLIMRAFQDLARANAALAALNANLEHNVAQRTQELAAAVERAEAADRLKTAFLATMSHELRTPLNSIIGFTGIVLQGLAGPLNDEQQKQLGMVRTSARHLLELINDVLDLSRIEAGQLQVKAENFDLRAAIERSLASVRPLAERKGLHLRGHISPSVAHMVSDRRRVEQILLNLLHNAIKFTVNGDVVLEADIDPINQAHPQAAPVQALRITVSDTGIGIKAEDMRLLFQPFSQVDTGISRQHDGTGLGLAICHRLALLLGGRITAHSQWGQGSSFTVVIPMELQ